MHLKAHISHLALFLLILLEATFEVLFFHLHKKSYRGLYHLLFFLNEIWSRRKTRVFQFSGWETDTQHCMDREVFCDLVGSALRRCTFACCRLPRQYAQHVPLSERSHRIIYPSDLRKGQYAKRTSNNTDTSLPNRHSKLSIAAFVNTFFTERFVSTYLLIFACNRQTS